MGRNRTIACQNCSKQMRSDKAIAHRQICGRLAKYSTEKCRICQKIMIKSNISRHMKRHDNHVFLTLKEDQSNYEKLAETGKIIQAHVEKENINPKSLRKEYILALNVHHNDNEDQEEKVPILKPWQTKLLELMEPSERNIIWVRGCIGNEGKSWFQTYLEDFYGRRRVYRSTVNKKSESLLHTLSKRNLAFVDVFIFNVPRSFNTNRVPYSFLEDIKDGRAISSKYNSSELKFVTPNIVIVFSNDSPCVDTLSTDRWKRYDISDDNLNDGFYFKKNEKKYNANYSDSD